MRFCFDYRRLNDCFVSKLGIEVLVCEEILRSWRKVGSVEDYDMFDIKKVYL